MTWKPDADGMMRADLEWSIEGKNGVRSGKLYGLHEQEMDNAKASVKRQARRGDTITLREV